MALMRLVAMAAVVLHLGSAGPCAAQVDTEARIDRFVEAQLKRQQIPGLALAVIRHGRIVVAKGYGLANVEHRVAVRPETVFQSGSMAKQFAAAAVAMLADEGRLSLDAPLASFFNDSPDSWKRITVRHLLTHTSGMTDYPDGYDLRRDYSEDELLAMVKAAPLAFEPGERWGYSNLGYVTLGILIRKLTGKFYGDFLRERFFAPLGMGTARVISESAIVPDRAAGYRLFRGTLENQEWVSPSVNTTADGSLYLTVLDMAQWDAALDGESLLKRAVLEQAWAPVTLNSGRTHPYGFGWHTGRLGGHRVVFHGGAWQGFQSFVIRFLDARLSLVFFANLQQAHAPMLARGLAAVFFPELALPAVQTIEDTQPAVTALLKRVLRQVAEGRADPAAFAADTRSAFFAGEVQRIHALLNTLSVPPAIISFAELTARREEKGLRIYRYVLTDLDTTLVCTLGLSADNKIALLRLSALGHGEP